MSSARLLFTDFCHFRAGLAFPLISAIPHEISGPATHLLIRNVYWAGRFSGLPESEAYHFAILCEKCNAPLLANMGDVFVQEEEVAISTFPVP